MGLLETRRRVQTNEAKSKHRRASEPSWPHHSLQLALRWLVPRQLHRVDF